MPLVGEGGVQLLLGARSIAGLPLGKAKVWVGPPLLASVVRISASDLLLASLVAL